MRLTVNNTDIPDWLKPEMKMFCECGAHLADDGPIGDDGVMQLTQRWCINPRCPIHMAQKIVKLADMFHIVGVGPATARSLISEHRLQHHLEVLPHWFKTKPVVELREAAEMAMLPGIDSAWQTMLSGMYSFTDYFNRGTGISEYVQSNEEYLKYCESFFTIKEPLLGSVLGVMLTGHFDKFPNRKLFIQAVNETYGNVVQIVDVHNAITKARCLIKEKEALDGRKASDAMNYGLPILTPDEFVAYLEARIHNKERGEQKL